MRSVDGISLCDAESFLYIFALRARVNVTCIHCLFQIEKGKEQQRYLAYDCSVKWGSLHKWSRLGTYGILCSFTYIYYQWTFVFDRDINGPLNNIVLSMQTSSKVGSPFKWNVFRAKYDPALEVAFTAILAYFLGIVWAITTFLTPLVSRMPRALILRPSPPIVPLTTFPFPENALSCPSHTMPKRHSIFPIGQACYHICVMISQGKWSLSVSASRLYMFLVDKVELFQNLCFVISLHSIWLLLLTSMLVHDFEGLKMKQRKGGWFPSQKQKVAMFPYMSKLGGVLTGRRSEIVPCQQTSPIYPLQQKSIQIHLVHH